MLPGVSWGKLLLQIGQERVVLGDPGVKLEYCHDWEAGMTMFSAVVADGRAVRITYRSWWAELGLDADDVRFVPERDEEEDYMAFIVAVSSDAGAVQRLVDRWATQE